MGDRVPTQCFGDLVRLFGRGSHFPLGHGDPILLEDVHGQVFVDREASLWLFHGHGRRLLKTGIKRANQRGFLETLLEMGLG